MRVPEELDEALNFFMRKEGYFRKSEAIREIVRSVLKDERISTEERKTRAVEVR